MATKITGLGAEPARRRRDFGRLADRLRRPALSRAATLCVRIAGWQLSRLNAGELIPLCAVAGAAGGLAGAWLAGLLAGSGPLRGARLQLPGTWFGAPDLTPLWAVLATASGAVLLMVLPSLRPVMPGAVRVSRGGQAAIMMGDR